MKSCSIQIGIRLELQGYWCPWMYDLNNNALLIFVIVQYFCQPIITCDLYRACNIMVSAMSRIVNVKSQHQIEFGNECCNASGTMSAGVVVVSALIYQ